MVAITVKHGCGQHGKTYIQQLQKKLKVILLGGEILILAKQEKENLEFWLISRGKNEDDEHIEFNSKARDPA